MVFSFISRDEDYSTCVDLVSLCQIYNIFGTGLVFVCVLSLSLSLVGGLPFPG